MPKKSIFAKLWLDAENRVAFMGGPEPQKPSTHGFVTHERDQDGREQASERKTTRTVRS